MTFHRAGILTSALLLATASLANAQEFPAGPVTIIAPFAAGGAVDTIARIVADDLQEAWSVPVLVQNMPGGSGMIAAQGLMAAAADGHTIMLATAGELAVNTTFLADSLTYDGARDFQPLALAALIPNVFVTAADKPWTSVEEFIAAASEAPGTLTYGSAGIGNVQHLTGELLAHDAGIELVHVPYKGSAQAVFDTMGGNIDVTFAAAATVLANVKDGSLRPLGVTSSERLDALPDVPSIAETQALGEFELMNWFGFVSRSGTDERVVARLHEALSQSLQSEETAVRLSAIGALYEEMSPKEFAEFIASETSKFGGVVEAASITPQ